MSNNKKIIMCVMLLVITLNVIVFVNPFKKKETKSEMLSILVEDTKGNYVENNNINFKEGYNLNKIKSHCEKNSKLLWDKENKKLKVKATESDKCYLYFDKERTGTENDPYEIQTIEDLVDLSNEVNVGDTKTGKYYVLVRDLDFNNPEDYEDSSRTDYGDINGINGAESLLTELTSTEGSGFRPIGFDNKIFSGTFDGKYNNENHKIKSLYISTLNSKNISQPNNFYALFGIVQNGVIKNLTVSGEAIAEVATPIGGIVNLLVNSTIENCVNEINITNNFGQHAVGGIVGWIFGDESSESKIINCVNKGNLSGGDYIGGVLGGHQAGNLIIENASNEGIITNNVGLTVGGIVGQMYHLATNLEMNNCHNNNEIKGSTSAVIGGLIGNVVTGNVIINNSYNTINGTITNNNNADSVMYIGGLIGISQGSLEISNSYNAACINHLRTEYNGFIQVDIGGLIGKIYNNEENEKTFKIIESYNLGNIVGGTYTGGIIGFNSGNVKTIINKSYNNGNINNSNLSFTEVRPSTETSGIIGYSEGLNSYVAKDYIINSYNSGSINGFDGAGGFIALSHVSTSENIINSYNVGEISQVNVDNSMGSSYGIGCFSRHQLSVYNKLIINNVYQLSKLNGTANFLIFVGDGVEYNVNNLYYKQGLPSTNLGLSKPENYMKSNDFVIDLNSNIINNNTLKTSNGNITLEEIDPVLKDYTLVNWKLGTEGYPTLDF